MEHNEEEDRQKVETDGLFVSSASDSSNENEIDCFERCYVETEFFYPDSNTDDEEDLESDDQTIDSCCLIAIGVPHDNSSDKNQSNNLQQQQHQQQHQHQSRDQRPPPLTTSDEAVAKSIARIEHNTKMRIKEEREATGRLRPTAPMKRKDTTATAASRADSGLFLSQPTSRSSASSKRADQEREEKMRTFEARRGDSTPRTRPLREGGAKPRAADSIRSGNRFPSRSVHTGSPRRPIRIPSEHRQRGLSPPVATTRSRGGCAEREEKDVTGEKQNPPIGDSGGAIQDGRFAPESVPLESAWSSSSDSANGETIGSGQSTPGSQRSVSSGIDLDDKTRQRILSRSALRRARPRRPLGSSVGNRNAGSTATSLSVDTSRRRPSDDKRNMRISPKISDTSSSNNTQPLQNLSPGVTRAIRPCDEKAAFRRRRYPPAASIPVTDNSPGATNIAAEQSANNNDGFVPLVSRHSLLEETAPGIGSDGLDLGVAPLEYANPRMESNNADDNSEQHRHHHSRDADFEARVVVDDEEPEILPGAFAVSGIGDDEEGQGVSGYDSGFENDTDSLLETMHSNAEDATEELLPPLDGNGDPETVGSSNAMAGVSAAVVTSLPLQAELYETEAAVTAVTAKILIVEEDPNTPKKIRKLSVQISCAFLVMFIVAGTIMAVVLPRVIRQNKGGIDTQNTDQDGAPAIEGWRPIGDVLTVDVPYKDNIRFGNAVAISANGNRLAIGLPGSDDSKDESLKSTGSVQIFDLLNGTEWEIKAEIFGSYSNAGLGTNVAISDDGKRVALGARSYGTDETGYVSIFDESNVTGQWALAANFSNGINSNSTEGGIFGDAVGFSGDGTVIAIGDKYFDALGLEDAGIVNIYQEINGTWNQMGNSLFGSKKGNLFGWSVALSKNGNRVAVSSLGGNEEPGNVKIFDFNGTSWEGAGSRLDGNSTRESFGVSVELSRDGSVVAVSATDYSRDGQGASVGIVRSYRYDEGTEEWSLYGQPLEGENEFDAFGSSISLSQDGDTIAIGGPENGNFCDDCGQVKIFRNSEETWKSSGSALGKSGIDSGQFGYAVALSATGNRVVGAAPLTTFNGFVSKVGQVLVFDSTVEDATNS